MGRERFTNIQKEVIDLVRHNISAKKEQAFKKKKLLIINKYVQLQG